MLKILKENEQSKQILSQAIMSDQFKNNDNARNTIIRANDLLDELSNNLDVYVKVNKDGSTELKAKLSDNSEGYIQIILQSPTEKAKVFLNGNIELSDNDMQKLQTVYNAVKNH